MTTPTQQPSVEIKNILHGSAARAKLLAGADMLGRAVKVTLGPKGRNVVIEKEFGDAPLLTKDGVSVAQEIDLEDPFEQMGAQLVKGASKKTSDNAGDGTTTSTVLACYLYQEGLKLVEAGFAPVQMKRGMDRAADYLSVVLTDYLSNPVKDSARIAQVGTISANGDEKIGRILAEAIEKVGKDGVIQIEEGKGMDFEIEVQEGLRWDRGPVLSEFLLKDGVEVTLEDVFVFVTDLPVNDVRLFLPILQEVSKEGKPILLVAPDFGQETVSTFYMNLQKGGLVSLPVRAPGFGDRQTQYLPDICVITGATFITKEAGWKFSDVKMEHLGFARKVHSTKYHTTITEGGGSQEDIEKKVTEIRAMIRASSSEFDREKLSERLSKLLGGICTIRVGAPTELAMKEIKARLEDALHATRSSVEEGVVPGGGAALFYAGKEVQRWYKTEEPLSDLPFPGTEEEVQGWNLVLRATEAPIRAILTNAGYSPDVMVDRLYRIFDHSEETCNGVDARTGEIVDMFEAGILDPTKVVRQALVNAVSIASTMLTVGCIIRKPENHTVLFVNPGKGMVHPPPPLTSEDIPTLVEALIGNATGVCRFLPNTSSKPSVRFLGGSVDLTLSLEDWRKLVPVLSNPYWTESGLWRQHHRVAPADKTSFLYKRVDADLRLLFESNET